MDGENFRGLRNGVWILIGYNREGEENKNLYIKELVLRYFKVSYYKVSLYLFF